VTPFSPPDAEDAMWVPLKVARARQACGVSGQSEEPGVSDYLVEPTPPVEAVPASANGMPATAPDLPGGTRPDAPANPAQP